MKQLALTLVLTMVASLMPHAIAQGPSKETTDTVAKPRPKRGASGETSNNPPETPTPSVEPQKGDKIESKYKRKPGEQVEGGPSFRTDATSVTVDVAVLD